MRRVQEKTEEMNKFTERAPYKLTAGIVCIIAVAGCVLGGLLIIAGLISVTTLKQIQILTMLPAGIALVCGVLGDILEKYIK